MSFQVGDWVRDITTPERHCHSSGAIGVIIRIRDVNEYEVKCEADTLTRDWRIGAAPNGGGVTVTMKESDMELHTPEPWRVERHEQNEAILRRQDLYLRNHGVHRQHEANLHSSDSRHALRERVRTGNRILSSRIHAFIRDESDDAEELADIINCLPIPSGKRLYHKLSCEQQELVFECPCCGAFQQREGSGEVRTSNNINEMWCEGCLDNDTYYSHAMGVHIPQDDAHSVYESYRAWNNRDPDDYVTWRYGNNNYYEYDNAFMDEDTYNEVAGYDEDNDEPDYRADGLEDYHGSDRDFSPRNSTPGVLALGVELEVYADDRANAVERIKNAVRGKEWYFERDGSLDDDHGFEVITQPYGPKEWPNYAAVALEALRSARAVGYNAGSGYGIHITVDHSKMSSMQMARILGFMLDTSNRDFITCIAQRSQIYGGYGSVQPGSEVVTKNALVRAVGGLRGYDKKPEGRGRYSPVNVKDYHLEFRIFQSTLLYSSFMKNLEFVWALIAWTDTKSSSGTTWHHRDFVAWLAQQRDAETRWPHLLAFLRKPWFTGVGFSDRVKNTWLNLLPLQTTKSLDVVAGAQELRLAA